MPIRDIFDKSGKKMGEVQGDHFHPTAKGVPNSFDAVDNFGKTGRVSGNTFTESAGGSGCGLETLLLGPGLIFALVIAFIALALVYGSTVVLLAPALGILLTLYKKGWRNVNRWVRLIIIISLLVWGISSVEFLQLLDATEGICKQVGAQLSQTNGWGDRTLSINNGSSVSIYKIVAHRQEIEMSAQCYTAKFRYIWVLNPHEACDFTLDKNKYQSLSTLPTHLKIDKIVMIPDSILLTFGMSNVFAALSNKISTEGGLPTVICNN